ncbi:hypothetical protein RS1P1_15870 [Pseudomonas moraviensis]|nr:hypothetical protein RS1P1_15870 [Pseudomonas moraviensis]
MAYRAECGSCKDQKPLTLALSRRDRGLTEVFGQATHMKYRIESKKAKNRPSTTPHNERKLEYRS